MPGTAGQGGLSGSQLKSFAVAPAAAPLSVPLTLDPSPTGGDLLTVLATQPSAAVSLVLPSGIEVGPANATSLGFTFNTFHVTIADGPGDLFLLSPGYNTWIAFPPSAPSGVYALKIDASQMPSAAIVTTNFLGGGTAGAAGIQAGLSTAAGRYAPGEPVTLRGIVFRDTAPVSGSTVRGTILRVREIGTQVTLGNYRLVSQAAVDPQTTSYRYSIDVTNTSTATLEAVTAEIDSSPAPVTISGGTLYFPSMSPGATVTSANTFTVTRDNGTTFSPNPSNGASPLQRSHL